MMKNIGQTPKKSAGIQFIKIYGGFGQVGILERTVLKSIIIGIKASRKDCLILPVIVETVFIN